MAKPIPRIRKHRVRERLRRQQPATTSLDTNVEELTRDAGKSARQQELKSQLIAGLDTRPSSKKKKRMDKYIVCGSLVFFKCTLNAFY